MVQLEDLIDIAIQKNASDIHLISGIKTMLRIIRKLEEIEEYDQLSQEDMYDIYDSIIKGDAKCYSIAAASIVAQVT